MNLTRKQIVIISLVCKGNGSNGAGGIVPIDLDQLLERVDWQPSKQSMQFSIRALIKHELIYKGDSENRRGRNRVVFFATTKGREMVQRTASESFIEPENSGLDDNFFASETSK